MRQTSTQNSTAYSDNLRRQKNIKTGLLIAATCLLLTVLILMPLVMLFERTIFDNGQWVINKTIETIMQPQNIQTIFNTLKLSFAVVIGSTLIALPLAFLLARTHFAKYKWLDIILMIPFMTPPYISAMGWILFTQRRGLFQQMFPATGSFSEGFMSFFGLAMVMSFHLFPFMLTILKNSLMNVPPNLEESAKIFGGNFWYRLRKVTFPLVTGPYAVGALLVFIKTASEYGTPATIGRRIGFNVFVTEIHRNATVSPIDFGSAAALSSVLILICILFWFLQNYISVNRTYRLVSGKGMKQSFPRIKGKRRFFFTAYLILILTISIGVPYFSVIVTSLINLRGLGMAAGNFTQMNYINLFTANPRGIQALQNSIFLGLVSATLTTVLGVLCATIIHSVKSKAKNVINIIGLIPDMLPSIVFVIGIMIFWNRIFTIIPAYNTIWILVIAYTALFLPFTVQSVSTSYAQISDSLVSAGKVFGGRPLYIFRRITLPLLLRGILAGWMMTFIIAFRELVTASIIAPPNTLVVSTFIMREFEAGSVSIGMAMAVICVVFSTTFLIIVNRFLLKSKED